VGRAGVARPGRFDGKRLRKQVARARYSKRSRLSSLIFKLAAGESLLLGASVYAEVMVRPLKRGSDANVDEFLHAARVTVIDLNRTLARRAAELLARHRSLRLDDGLSLATALRRAPRDPLLERTACPDSGNTVGGDSHEGESACRRAW